MALFDNVTFDFYKNDLGRSVVPGESEFDRYALENKLFVKSLIDDGLISGREKNGTDSAVCLMIEEDYKHSLVLSGETAPKTSENISGYSYSRSAKAADAEVDKDTKSLAEKKYKWLSYFCDIHAGVR